MENSIVPEAFIQWAYRQRGALINRQAQGEEVKPHEIFLGFCRHTPAVVSNGPAGLNASIKGVGFLPKRSTLRKLWKLTWLTSPRVGTTATAGGDSSS